MTERQCNAAEVVVVTVLASLNVVHRIPSTAHQDLFPFDLLVSNTHTVWMASYFNICSLSSDEKGVLRHVFEMYNKGLESLDFRIPRRALNNFVRRSMGSAN
ncbi:hypothetical protein AX14_013754 [Amanita brunnescens Koide BX004]|jgi:hypothetical protein|nr:hypothetical protein AX14_013754 [Amanita brunnescens Koide BX004]